MTAPGPIVASAVGFDLGEALYHYGVAPLSWIERGRPAFDKTLDAWGKDRSKADVAAAHGRVESYSSYLRERIEDVSAADVWLLEGRATARHLFAPRLQKPVRGACRTASVMVA